MTSSRPIILFLLAGLAGCASVPAPPELVDARRAYTHASEGPARDLVPAQLLAAPQALNAAEQSFTDAPESERTRALAYIAQRKAEIAATQGALVADQRDKAGAEQEVAQLEAAQKARMAVELRETRAELAGSRQVLAGKEQELSAEQRARREAEHRARAALASLEKVAAVKEEARGMVITLNGAVLFATGQSTLLPIAKDRLHEVAKALKDNPHGAIVVEGHTDSTGSQSANEELSRHRAEAVREYLVEHGVAADRVRAVGVGPNRPIADNKTPEGRANNRRVEIVVEPAKAR